MSMRLRKSAYPRMVLQTGGHEYAWGGWFGSQLVSREWLRVPAGTTRELDLSLCGPRITVTVCRSEREGLGYRTTWAVGDHGTFGEYAARIQQLKDAMRALV